MPEEQRPHNVFLSADQTSHGIRRGTMEDLSDNPNVGFAATAKRSGLLLEAISNVFRYINGSVRKDKQCGVYWNETSTTVNVV